MPMQTGLRDIMENVIPALDIQKLTEGVPRGQWVAIASTRDRMIAHGDTVGDVISESKAKGEGEPIVMRVPETATLIL